MHVLFLTGSLEPGRDGVGDYTRRLAGELIRQGHLSSIISLNDQHLTAISDTIQIDQGKDIQVLRLPAALSWKSRVSAAKKWIDRQNPDWISIQFVPYSFHKKGLPVSIADRLKSLGKNRNWHIMFHELWVGIKENAPISHRFYGSVQKIIARSLVTALQPKYITTSNRIYQLELQHQGINAHVLSLFSNIALQPINEIFITSIYKKLNIEPLHLKNYYFLGVFGSLYSDIDLSSILNEQLEITGKQNKKLVFLAFGRSSNETELRKLETFFKDKILFGNIGELPDHQVSSLLQILDMGICSTPKEYIGKSGVYAAMKLHKVPVLVRSAMVIPEYQLEIESFNSYLERRESYKWDVHYIATKFYENICLYSNLQPS